MDGILNVNKPAGWTSHDVVAFIRRRLGERRAGHAGTLDPFATGVLLVCLGQATRVAEYLTASTKTYCAVAELGVTTDTYDLDGQVTARAPVPALAEADLKQALAFFTGEIAQTPPAYSAVKQGGVPAYRRARRGEEVALAPRRVRIHEIRLLRWDAPVAEFEVTCDPGTYIRSLAHDLGQTLGCGAILTGLTRTRSGAFCVEDAVAPDALAEAAASGEIAAYLHPIRSALHGLIAVPVSAAEVERLAHGQTISAADAPSSSIGYAVGADGDVYAILQYNAERLAWQPTKVFAGSTQG
jgi:tRNA pseudouridine55 synthase